MEIPNAPKAAAVSAQSFDDASNGDDQTAPTSLTELRKSSSSILPTDCALAARATVIVAARNVIVRMRIAVVPCPGCARRASGYGTAAGQGIRPCGRLKPDGWWVARPARRLRLDLQRARTSRRDARLSR